MRCVRLTRSVLVVCAVAVWPLLVGCATRSLASIERSGDRAFAAGDYQLASQEYKEYVDRRPGKARVQFALGEAYMALGQPEAASHTLYLAHDMEPTNEQYTTALAEALYKAGDQGKLYDFLRSMTEQPGRVEDYTRLGRYAAQLGDVDEAKTALLTAAKIDGGKTIGPQLALADFYQQVGDKENSLKRLRMALFLDPANAEVAARIRELGEIPGPSFSIVPEEAGG
jgi:cytochrome c-type biogenesis protein CcmH/NrfG